MIEIEALFKIGGELLENLKSLKLIIDQLILLYQSQILDKIVILPGGGKLANFVRVVDKKLQLGNTLSHWMAILAMEINGNTISQEFNLSIIKTPKQIDQSKRVFSIFLPYDFLKKKDELPHKWQVTSDSIALYLTHKLGFKNCFLLKNVDGILLKNGNLLDTITTKQYLKLKEENKLLADVQKKKNTRPVDNYLMNLIDDYGIPCIILNGTQAYLKNYFHKRSDGTKKLPSTKIIPIQLGN